VLANTDRLSLCPTYDYLVKNLSIKNDKGIYFLHRDQRSSNSVVQLTSIQSEDMKLDFNYFHPNYLFLGENIFGFDGPNTCQHLQEIRQAHYGLYMSY